MSEHLLSAISDLRVPVISDVAMGPSDIVVSATPVPAWAVRGPAIGGQSMTVEISLRDADLWRGRAIDRARHVEVYRPLLAALTSEAALERPTSAEDGLRLRPDVDDATMRTTHRISRQH